MSIMRVMLSMMITIVMLINIILQITLISMCNPAIPI